LEADRVSHEEDVIDDVPVGVQKLFDERHYRAINRNVRKSQPALFKAAVLCGIILLSAVYFIMPNSRVSSVSVSGSSVLSAEYIKDLADVDSHSLYFLSFPFLVERRIEKDPLIENAEVSLEKDNTLKIEVTEKKILGYRYDEEPVILLTDGTSVPLKSEYLDLISKVPFVIGFLSENQTAKLCRCFKDVDEAIIRDISEISQYSLSYDAEAIRVLMRSGGYFMGNYYNIEVLNRYWDIYNHQKDKSQCIFADDSKTSAFSKVCPWNEEQVDKEYWKDEDGNIITNTYGDKVEKHYYLDEEGEFALDGAGRKIPVPISLQGFEVPDEKFLEHYAEGFYSTGELVIPSWYDDEDTQETEAAEDTEG